MGLVSTLFPELSATGPFKPWDDFWYQNVSGGTTTAGITVTEHTALQVGAVFACVKVISETIASLPCIVYRRLDNGGKERAPEHPVYSLLHDSPNEWQTAFEFFEDQTGHAALHGTCFAEILPGERGSVDQLIPYGPELVTVEQLPSRRLRYQVRQQSKEPRPLTQDQMLHVRGRSLDGVNGISVNRQARDAIALARAIETYGARFFANDATLGLLLEHPARLSKEAAKRLKDDLMAWVGPGRAFAPKVLEEGMKVTRMQGTPARDAQLTEAQQEAVIPICQFFRMPPHKIQHLLRSTFSNIEHQGIEFATDTMAPWARRWEQRINASLISDPAYYAEFLFAALLRGDNAGRSQYYQSRFSMASLSPNDIRRLENENPIDEPWADKYYLQGAMVPADRAGEFLDQRKQGPRRQEDGEQTNQPAKGPTALTAPAPIGLLSAGPRAPSRAFAVLIADAAGRIAKAEVRQIENRPQKSKSGPRLEDWLASFYREHNSYVVHALNPLAEAWHAETGQLVNVAGIAFAVQGGGFRGEETAFSAWASERPTAITAILTDAFALKAETAVEPVVAAPVPAAATPQPITVNVATERPAPPPSVKHIAWERNERGEVTGHRVTVEAASVLTVKRITYERNDAGEIVAHNVTEEESL